ncbi:MAG: ABC transporter ATP-binding protein [Myxococcota bacterium]|nr:ABC transporter ATP-binding protein [Myxococcota bacterium]
MSALTLRGVVKTYRKNRALDGLSISVPEGAVCGLVGPNGAGKTTTYGVVGGFIQPDAGEVDILGSGPFDPATHSGRLTLLPQDCSLSPYMPVRELLIHLARLQGLSLHDARTDARRVLELVDLSDRAEQRIKELSHGMRRRVATAQAFLGDPALILLDEPTSGLDPSQVVRLRDVFRSQRGKRTLIISSHILSELEATCDHVILVEDGRCVRQGPMSEITGRGALLRVTVGSTPPVDAISDALPGLRIRLAPSTDPSGGELLIESGRGTSTGELNARVLPVLLEAGVVILEVHQGHSLEAALLAGHPAGVAAAP